MKSHFHFLLLESKYLRTGAEVTASLILSKATSCCFVHNHGTSSWVRRLIGSQISEGSPRNFERYLAIPIRLCTAATSLGFFILRIAFTLAGSGLRPSFARRRPMNCKSSHFNVNFVLLSLMFRSLHRSRSELRFLSWSSAASCYVSP